MRAVYNVINCICIHLMYENLIDREEQPMASRLTNEEMNTRVEQLQATVSKEEAKLTELYPQIGKRYCECCADNPLPEVADLVASVNAVHQKIRAINKEIGLLRGIVTCPICGKEVSVHSAFCGSCGTSMSAVLRDLASEDDVICPACGLATPHGSVFCEKCGAKLSDAGKSASAAPGRVPTPAPAPAPAPAPKPAPESKPRCPKCGTELEKGDLFCPECGTRMPNA